MSSVLLPTQLTKPSGPPALTGATCRHLGLALVARYAEPGCVPAPPSIEALLARLGQALGARDARHERAFQAEFLAFSPNLKRFAMSLTKDPTRADDLVQDTLLRAWRSRARFEPETNLGAWLFTIMRNAFYTSHRKGSREVGAPEDGTDASVPAVVPAQQGHMDLQDMHSALGRLPAAMREALTLVAIEERSYEEAAAVMNCRIGTVKSRVWRAREQLAALLGLQEGEFGSDSLTLSIVSGPRLTAHA